MGVGSEGMAQSPCLSVMTGCPGELRAPHGCGLGSQRSSGTRERVGGTAGDAGADTLDVQAPGRRCLQTRQGLEELFAQQIRVGQHDRVLPAETGRTQLLSWLRRRLDHRVLAQVAEAVGADAGADLLNLEAGSYQLGPGGEVDAVEAGPFHRRAGDAYVDLGRSGLSQHPDLGALGFPAHDRVVNDY